MGVILSGLGEDVTFTHGTGTSTVRGVFQNPYQAGDVGLVGVSGTNPSFAVLTTEIGTVAKDDTIVRGAVTYKVRAIRADDPVGVTVLDLRRS
jgi:hypothetical protein